MDFYARAFRGNMQIKNFYICVFGHQIILKDLKLTNQVRMDHNDIRLIFTSIATLIHSTGTSN